MKTHDNDITIHIATGSIIKVIVVTLLFAVLFILRDLLLVIVAAIVVASSVEPITRWCMARRLPRLPSVITIYVSVAVLLTGAFYFLVLPLLAESSQFISALPEYIHKSSQSIQESSFLQSEPLLRTISTNLSLETFADKATLVIANLSGGFWNAVSVAFGSLLSFALIIVLSFYLAVQENGVGKFLKIITPRKHEAYVIDLWRRAEIKIGLWMQGQLLLGVIVAVLVYLGLALLGVPHALLLAVLAGICELIPLFGPIIAATPGVLVSFVDGGLTMALLVTGFYLVVQQFENQLIYPLVVKKVVGVPPIIVILALVAGAQLGGFLGLLLSVPIAAVIMEFINDLEHDKFAGE